MQAVAVELDLKLSPSHKRSDAEIAEAAEGALNWHSEIPKNVVRIRVEKGWITLDGELDWDFQRSAAKRAVQALIGVVGLSNNITLKVHLTPADIGARIRQALERHALDEAKGIQVEVKGAKAVLRGTVHSWAERSAAQGAAWSAPGIVSVEDDLRVAA
ncbi:BON domain-containing protein [Variovorax humicola]|uniref:BON domain-containing protein n=1 Tax=Variovorax humicola TaxID=1769758 RepID=A0ABU8W9I6_9BURK